MAMGTTQNGSDNIWLHWATKLESSTVTCIYCTAEKAKHTTRLKKHTARCLKAPKNIRDHFMDNLPLSVSGKKRSLNFQSSQSSVTPTCDVLELLPSCSETGNKANTSP